MPSRATIAFQSFLLLSACTTSKPSAASDPQLATEIASIEAIDNHAHPVRPTIEGEPADTEYDALPVENLEAQADPIRMRPTNPEFAFARKTLFNGDKAGAAKKYSRDDYAAKVLDQLHIQIMLANRVAVGPGLAAPRFRWVAFADALMYPLPNDAIIHNSDHKAFFALEEKLLKRYYAESGVTAKPAKLDDYLTKVVAATLQRHKDGGAIAEKFEMAYLRALDIGNPSKADAEKAYAGTGDYKTLQDYIFRFIAAECGRLGMAVHFHTGAGGGGYFNVSGSNPMLLEPLFNDPALRKTNFVLLHGGWPFENQLAGLLTKPNVYADFSAQTVMNYPRSAAETIRRWVEYVPEKVLFATDAYPFAPPDLGWEELAFVANAMGREALRIAVTDMLHDGEITRERASELAHMVLHDNAAKLYNLK